jgi:hypothetical protein
MNEKIKELAKLADPGYTGNSEDGLGASLVGNDAIEKFAELIVRECIERVCNQYTPVRDSTIEGRPNPFFPELRVRTECEQAVIESGIKNIMALEELIQESTDRWHKENILGDEA